MWVSCIFVNITLKAKRPINQAYPKELVTLGDHLRTVRLDRGLSQPQVAEKMSCDESNLRYIKLDQRIPLPKTRFKIEFYISLALESLK